jgi:hypothetical protein
MIMYWAAVSAPPSGASGAPVAGPFKTNAAPMAMADTRIATCRRIETSLLVSESFTGDHEALGHINTSISKVDWSARCGSVTSR